MGDCVPWRITPTKVAPPRRVASVRAATARYGLISIRVPVQGLREDDFLTYPLGIGTNYPFLHLSSLFNNLQVVAGTAPDSWKAVRPRSASMLQRALAKQPVAVAVAASRDWM